MASLVNIALILLRKWIWYIKIFICQGRCYNFKPLICATSPGPNCLVCPIPYSSTNAFQSLGNLYEGLCLRSYFEFKTREEYHKLQSDTIFIDVYLIWGGLCIKKGTKRVKKSQICVSRLLEALFVVTK